MPFSLYEGNDLYARGDPEVLLKHAREHVHLLLHRSERTWADERGDAEVEVIGCGFLLGFCVMVGALFWLLNQVVAPMFSAHWLHGRWGFPFASVLVVLVTLGAHRLLVWRRLRRTVNWGHERKAWIHTERRKYVLEEREFGKEPRTTQWVRSLDELVVSMRFSVNGDTDESHEVELSEAPTSTRRPERLLTLYSCRSGEAEARRVGQALASLWRLPFHDTDAEVWWRRNDDLRSWPHPGSGSEPP